MGQAASRAVRTALSSSRVGSPGCREWARCWWRWPGQVGQIGEHRDDHPVGERGEERADTKSVGGDAIDVGGLDAFDEALQA